MFLKISGEIARLLSPW